MKITRLTFALVTTSCLLLPGSAAGHHGWTEFDEKAEVTFDATVKDFHFVNPHCVVEFDREDENGHVRRWQGEFSNPGVLSRKGWNAASLEAGDKITITGHPSKNSSPAIHVTRIRMPNGQDVSFDSRE